MSKTKVPFLVSPGSVRDLILAGAKTATIRVGNRVCSAGDELVLYCHIEPWVVMADVVSVRRCALREVTAQEFADDGYDPATAAEQFIANLRPYHPEVGPDSTVTVIRFTNVRGALADEYRAAQTKLESERRGKKLCPKCGSGSADHEMRDFSEVSRDGDIY